MKNIFRSISRVIQITILLTITHFFSLQGQVPEFLLIDKQFTWSDQTGGDGCLGYHFWYDMGEANFTNWREPYNFYNGQFYFRYEIIDQPGSFDDFGLNFCIWADDGFEPGKWKETCSSVKWFYSEGSVVTFNESPAGWWKLEGGIDWTRLDKLWRFGNPFWIDNQCQLASNYCTCADPDIWRNDRDNWLPMEIRITIVAVAQGHSFSGWDYFLNGGNPTLRQPTPTYGIDYSNERTNKVVSSRDEYAYNSSMTGAISGNGSALPLTPGEEVYFRRKANGDTLASYIQELTVPSRPAAPAFAWDQANQRTSTIVSSEYEHSGSSNMSGAVSGTGTYVSIPAGTTKYFRKKATGSAFRSNIQTLTGVNNPTIGPEFVILNETIDFPNSTDNNGFYFFYHNSSMPVNWLTPYDYYNGQVYTRYEIISQATSTPVGLQFGIWQRLPVGSTNDADLYESMAEIRTLNGPGSVVTHNSSPNSWWTYHGGVDYAQMNNVWHFGINPWQVSPSNKQIRQENADVWASRYTYWFPMKVKVTVVAVASGYTFSGWSNYVNNKPATPNYGIDYNNEQTDKTVPATDEYSVNSNMTGAISGTGQKITITPGQNVYFRTKAQGSVPASDIQALTVPARPSTPTFGIDYPLETTAMVITSEYEYSLQSNMSGANSGTGVKIEVTPGTDLYFRKKATSSAFRSFVQHLTVPSRPSAPQVGIDYQQETTLAAIPSNWEFSYSADMSQAVSGSGQKIALTPGTNKYFRILATGSSFSSDIQLLTVPSRPAAPSFSIDYVAENTTLAVSSDYEYSPNASMSSAMSGSGAKVNLTPGINMHFRKKATGSAFKSGIQTLTVPARPSAPVFTIDYTNEATGTTVSDQFEYADNAAMNGAVTGSGTILKLNPSATIYFRGKATSSAFSSAIQTLVVPERPAAPSPAYTIDFFNATTVETVPAGQEYAMNSSMTDAVSGTGAVIELNAGVNVYFRWKSTASSFASSAVSLIVPERPSIQTTASDTLENDFFLALVDFNQEAEGFDLSDVELTNAEASVVSPLLLKVVPISQGEVSLKVVANAISAGNFESEPLGVYYKPLASSARDIGNSSASFLPYPNPVNNYLYLETGSGLTYPLAIELLDIRGITVLKTEIASPSAGIDVGYLSGGMYILKGLDAKGNMVTSGIVKR